MIRLDDPLDFFQGAGASDDILQQIRDQMPQAVDPFPQAFQGMNPNTPDDNSGDAFGFRGFAADTLDFLSDLNISPNNSLGGNLWNAGTGAIESFGFDLGPIGVLNPNDDLSGNISRVTNWAMKNLAEVLRDESGIPDTKTMVKDIFRNAFGRNSTQLISQSNAASVAVPEGVTSFIGKLTSAGGASAGAVRGAAAGAARGAAGGIAGIAIGAVIGALSEAVDEDEDEEM